MTQLGYGGVANTFGTRDFSGKEEAVSVPGKITNIASHFTRPTELTSWLVLLIPEALRLWEK